MRCPIYAGTNPPGLIIAAAVGLGNQPIFLVPSERLAVTIFAGEYNKLEGHSERTSLV